MFQLYVPLNIFIALVGVVVWTEYDEISLSSNGDTTLTNFLHYRRERLVKEHPNDNAQLLTYVKIALAYTLCNLLPVL
jgi:Reprolysin (M12B) family zinc metalloprotease.